jgi:hypothetical protein
MRIPRSCLHLTASRAICQSSSNSFNATAMTETRASGTRDWLPNENARAVAVLAHGMHAVRVDRRDVRADWLARANNRSRQGLVYQQREASSSSPLSVIFKLLLELLPCRPLDGDRLYSTLRISGRHAHNLFVLQALIHARLLNEVRDAACIEWM